MLYYNYKTGFFENNDDKYQTREEAHRNKWKCDKCSDRFQSYRMLARTQDSISLVLRVTIYL